MTLSHEDRDMYKTLYNVLAEPTIGDLLVKWTNIQYNKAIIGLKTAKDIHEIARFQGQISAFEAVLNLKKLCLDILKGV